MIKDNETWVDVPNYKGVYKINRNGDILSFAKKNKKILKPQVHYSGYKHITLGSKHYTHHRLLAEIFIPNPDNKTQVNHKNGVKADNRLENLEWVTPSENVKHAYRNNLKSRPIGVSNFNNKLNEEEVVSIRSRYKTGKYTYKKLAKLFSISEHNIKSIVLRKTWKHLP